MKKEAFTLAETLITLAIIGIVAALTVPTIVTNYQKKQTVVGLKKAYSTLTEAINRSIADNGPMQTWMDSSYSGTKYEFLDKYLFPYLNIAKRCDSTLNNNQRNALKDECDFVYYDLEGNKSSYAQSSDPRIILNDGTRISFNNFHISATDSFTYIAVDVNGKKGPNTYGKDVFGFFIRFYYHNPRSISDSLITTVGSRNLPSRESLINGSYGQYGCQKHNTLCVLPHMNCAKLIIKDGWKISDDYPW